MSGVLVDNLATSLDLMYNGVGLAANLLKNVAACPPVPARGWPRENDGGSTGSDGQGLLAVTQLGSVSTNSSQAL